MKDTTQKFIDLSLRTQMICESVVTNEGITDTNPKITDLYKNTNQ